MFPHLFLIWFEVHLEAWHWPCRSSSVGGRTLHILPTHPSFPPPPLDNMQIYFGKYIFHLLWPTCRYILANTLFSIFLLDNTQIYLCKYYIFHLSFGQHANIFGQILYFPSSFKTKCKYFFADIFPPALDNMQIYFHFLGQQANRCLHFGCFMPKLGLCRKPPYPKIKKWLQFI